MSNARAPITQPAGGPTAARLRYCRRQNGNHFRQYWLAIASLGPGTVEDGGFSGLLGRNYSTEFDRIFLISHGRDARLVGARDVTPFTPNVQPLNLLQSC